MVVPFCDTGAMCPDAAMQITRTTRVATAVLAVVLGGGFAACGDDEDAAEGSTATTAADAGGGEGGGGSDLAAACDAYAAIPEQVPDDGPPEDPDAVEGLIADLEAGAPEAVQEDVATVAAALRAALGGDPEALDEEVFGTYTGIGAELIDVCPADEVLEVDALDYAFGGIPDTLPAGRVNVRLVNRSEADEAHEMLVLRRRDDETRSFDELLVLPQEEAEATVEELGFTFVPPGAEAGAFLDLEPGDYVAVCFVPVGGVDEGTPHAFEGMRREFTVE